jgi:hypothetical protein
MKRELTQPSAGIRSVFAVVAIVITASIGGFIDHLATDYKTAPRTTVQAAATQAVALAARR